MQNDMSLVELEQYAPEIYIPPDFDSFWAAELEMAESSWFDPRFEPNQAGLELVEVFDVTFAGHGGDPVRGWLLLPAHTEQVLPCIVEFIGYGGGRGLPHERLAWSCAGFAHLIMDTRGQGSVWSRGATADSGGNGEPSVPGFLTRGLGGSPSDHYYVRLMIDAANAASQHLHIDSNRIAVAGQSQGGGLALAAAHLRDDVKAVMSDVPFLSHYRRALEVTDAAPYSELAAYCAIHRDQIDSVFHNLAYVDVVNHGMRATSPALFSVGLADTVTPPSTVYAAYNHYQGPKSICVYPYNGHEGGGADHMVEQLRFAANLIG
jgi:cephalosporin-C deacetylase